MARGLQKVQSQQKNAEAAKKAQGGKSHLKANEKSLSFVCPSCKQPVMNVKNLREHFESKHSALPAPDYEALEAAAKAKIAAATPAAGAKKK